MTTTLASDRPSATAGLRAPSTSEVDWRGAEVSKPAQMRMLLVSHRTTGLPFDEAWAKALKACFGKRRCEWREPVEWAKPIFKDAYERTGQRFKLSEGMLEDVVV